MRIGVDIGGTFTDLVAFDETSGDLRVAKALNSATHVVGAVRDALQQVGLEFSEIDEFVHGTTMVTNLLIERTGAQVGLVCSSGFRDLVELGRGYRPGTFNVGYQKRPPIVPRRLRREISGRIDASGEEVESISEKEIMEVLRALVSDGAEVIAVSLHNSYANQVHERRVREICRSLLPDIPVTVSTDIDNRIGEYERSSTACLNAMAVPRMNAYADELEEVVGSRLYYMHSAGGMLPSREARERPIQLAVSGPAAGVLAARQLGRWAGFSNIIALDVGGTSTDVCLVWNDEFQEQKEFDVEWGVPARTRSLAIHTIGAGGGSIAARDAGGALQVGPRSAGASPGPACYGRGGAAPTVTDANLALGILPSNSGLLGGGLSLDSDAARQVLHELALDFDSDVVSVASGIFSLVNANMAQAIRRITVEKGIDPRDSILVAYGGAGPQHAVHVAQELGIRTVAVPAHAGAFSALGLLLARRETSAQASVLRPLKEAAASPEVDDLFDQLTHAVHERLGASSTSSTVDKRFAGLRYEGQSHEVPIEWLPGSVDEMVTVFEEEHFRLFGTQLGQPIEVVDIWATSSVETVRKIDPSHLRTAYSEGDSDHAPKTRFVSYLGSDVPVHRRGSFDEVLQGPRLIEEPNSVTYVPPDWEVRDESSHLVIRQIVADNGSGK